VLLGGDRSRIRFNAQAGGSHRARTIRDYCLGVFRSGDEGRKRRTATTYISLVFRDTETGLPLTAGIALGASVDEPEHRVHGLYLLPGVALDAGRPRGTVNGKELPLAWADLPRAAWRCAAARQPGRARAAHRQAERFLKDLLLRLRASPAGQSRPQRLPQGLPQRAEPAARGGRGPVRAHAGGRGPAHRHRPLPRAAG
jgi:chromosome segregation protein